MRLGLVRAVVPKAEGVGWMRGLGAGVPFPVPCRYLVLARPGASPRVGRYRWVAQWAFPAWRGPGCGLRPYPGYAAARWALPARQGPGCSTKKAGHRTSEVQGPGRRPSFVALGWRRARSYPGHKVLQGGG